MWYSLLSLKKNTDNTLSASVTVGDDSPWFSGHFPDNPILPGIAQLNIIAEVIALSRQENLCIKTLRRVKFKKIVQPGERLELHILTKDETNHYTFRITSELQDVCSGTISLGEKPALEKTS